MCSLSSVACRIGLARISAVRASPLMVATVIIVVSGVVLGGSWVSMIKSL